MRCKILLLASALVAAGIASAATTDALQISTNGLTATITDNVVGCVGTGCPGLLGDLNPTAGTTLVSGSIGNWTISFTSGTSHTPSLTPFGIDIANLVASCTGASCTGVNSLEIKYSDINFTVPVGIGGFVNGYSLTGGGAGDSTTQSAFFDNSNTLFGEPGAGSLGSVTCTSTNVCNPASGQTTGGSIATAATYSLTIDDIFSGTSSASFSSDGSITATPEPMSILLLGTLVGILGYAFRRRFFGNAA